MGDGLSIKEKNVDIFIISSDTAIVVYNKI